MLVGDRAAWLFALVLGTHVINVSAHAAYAIGENRYNPGLVTAITLLLPAAGVGFHTWINAGRMTVAEAVLGLVLTGCAAAAGSHEYQRRLRRSWSANGGRDGSRHFARGRRR
jgi:hypothetical protein